MARTCAIVALAALSLSAAGLRGESWDVIKGLRAGQEVKIIDSGGKTHKGEFLAVSDEGISVETGKGQVTVDRQQVRRVQVRSGRKRAIETAVGVGIGVGLGLVIDATLGTYARNETGQSGEARFASYAIPIAVCGAAGGLRPAYATIYRVR